MGVAGFAIHGGVHFGAYSELYGLASDTIVALTAVLANSSIFHFTSFVEEEEEEAEEEVSMSRQEARTYSCTMDSSPMIQSHCHDLVYAFCGAGSSFGIVTSITMKLFPQHKQKHILHSALSILSIRITDFDAAARILQAYIGLHTPFNISYFIRTGCLF